LTDNDLLDIPEFLKRQSNGKDSNNTTIIEEETIEVKVVEPQKVQEVVEKTQPEKSKKPSIQDRMRSRFYLIMGDLQDEFEKVWANNGNPKEFKAYNYFAVNDIPGAFMKMIIDDIADILDEERKGLAYRDIPASDRTDIQEDYVESFESYTKKEMQTHISWWERVVKDCEIWKLNKLKSRKPRKYKPPSKEKLAKKVKYKLQDDDVKLTSIEPVNIIGSHGLVVYNSKTRKLGLYEATHKHHGLTLKGTSIINYDDSTSVQKTLRKPLEVLERVHTGGLQAFKNTLESVKATDVKLTGRLNSETILVRVFN
jgi:hypothetical protein